MAKKMSVTIKAAWIGAIAALLTTILGMIFSSQPSVDVTIEEPSSKIQGIVLIDPGHGGHDSGTSISQKSKEEFSEKDFALAVGLELNHQLKKLGIQSKLTREKDEFVSLGMRARTANEIDPAAFISIHANHSSDKSATGAQIKYNAADSSLLATSIRKALAGEFPELQFIPSVVSANFFIIRNTDCPTVWIECGFFSNQRDFERLKQTYFQKLLARTLAIGIKDYLTSNPAP